MRARSAPASLAAPVGGWNARDALGAMPTLDAVYLTNLFPRTTDVVLRNGYTQHATGLSTQVETLMSYSGAATNKLFAATAGGSIFDVTSSGAVGAAVVTGMTNGRWQYTNVATAGGNFLIAFNGADNGLRYNGTTWVAIPATTGLTVSACSGTGTVCTLTVTAHGLLTGNTITTTGFTDAGYNQASVTITRINANSFSYAGTGTGGTVGSGAYTVAEGLTGVTPSGIVGVELFKNRLWLTQNASLTPYYLGTDAVAGAATAFPVQSIAQEGGYVQAIQTWTGDAGYGMDDMLILATNKGEIIIYNGLDPASATTWQLTGVWQLGSTIGRRCMMKYAGDVLLICQDGLMPMSQALKASRMDPSLALSAKIQSAVSESISSYGSTFGWQLLYFAKENMLFLNVPVAVGSQQQYVMNTISGAWCNFTGWNANCWEIFGDDPYFGGNGFVGRAWNGTSDANANITGDGKQAFNYFGSPGTLKRWTMMRPMISTNGSPGILAALNVDFDDTPPTSPVTYTPSNFGVWDTGTWDTSAWGGGNLIQKSWQGVTGVGYCAAIRLTAVSQGLSVQWLATDLVMEPGAIL